MFSHSLDDKWHHICCTWTQTGGMVAFYKDSSRSESSGKGEGASFSGGGSILIGRSAKQNDQYEGQITYMNMWDRVLSEAFIQRLANFVEAEMGNVLHWSFFAAMTHGDVHYSLHSSISPKGTKLTQAYPDRGEVNWVGGGEGRIALFLHPTFSS